jgi:hypothetical protein
LYEKGNKKENRDGSDRKKKVQIPPSSSSVFVITRAGETEGETDTGE